MHNGNLKFPGNLKHHKNEVETTANVLCPTSLNVKVIGVNWPIAHT
jgi:hypothetical protein